MIKCIEIAQAMFFMLFLLFCFVFRVTPSTTLLTVENALRDAVASTANELKECVQIESCRTMKIIAEEFQGSKCLEKDPSLIKEESSPKMSIFQVIRKAAVVIVIIFSLVGAFYLSKLLIKCIQDIKLATKNENALCAARQGF